MIGDLTTLAKVKIYLTIDSSEISSDAILQDLISSESEAFRTGARRDIIYQRYVETRDGNGKPGIEPRQYPVQRIESVTIDGNDIPAQPATVAGQAPQYGYVVSNDRIEIAGTVDDRLPFVLDDEGQIGVFALLGLSSLTTPRRFTRGRANVALTYWAGYAVLGEAWAIPAAPYQVQVKGNFQADARVLFASDSSALTLVASAPSTGQYTVSDTGLYTFAAADTGKGVLIDYGVVPADIRRAVHQMIEAQYNARSHAGQRSLSKGDAGTVYFDMDAIPARAQSVIDKYERKSI